MSLRYTFPLVFLAFAFYLQGCETHHKPLGLHDLRVNKSPKSRRNKVVDSKTEANPDPAPSNLRRAYQKKMSQPIQQHQPIQHHHEHRHHIANPSQQIVQNTVQVTTGDKDVPVAIATVDNSDNAVDTEDIPMAFPVSQKNGKKSDVVPKLDDITRAYRNKSPEQRRTFMQRASALAESHVVSDRNSFREFCHRGFKIKKTELIRHGGLDPRGIFKRGFGFDHKVSFNDGLEIIEVLYAQVFQDHDQNMHWFVEDKDFWKYHLQRLNRGKADNSKYMHRRQLQQMILAVGGYYNKPGHRAK